MKTMLHGIKGRLDTEERKISKLVNIAIETNQNETERAMPQCLSWVKV